MLEALTPNRWELIQRIKGRGPVPVGDLVASGMDDRSDLDALVELSILGIDDRQRGFIPWDEIDLTRSI